MFGSKITSSGHSTGNPFAPNPFGVPSNLGSPFTMPNASGTTSSVVGTTYSPFSTLGSQSAPAFGGTASGSGFSSAPSLGFSSSGFGSQVSTPPFSSQTKGSRVATYARTAGVDASAKEPEYLVSISAMPIYKDKSHQELKWEDYQSGDKGGFVSRNFNRKPNAFTPVSASATSLNSSTSNIFAIPNVASCATCPPFTSSFNSLASKNPFSFTSPSTTPAFSVFSSSCFTNSITTSSCSPSTSVTMPACPFGPSRSSSPFGPTSSSSPFGPTSSSSPFGPTSSSSPFGPTSTPSPFGPTSTPSPFGPTSTPSPFGPSSTPSPFGPSSSSSPFGPSSSSSPFGPTSSSSPFGPTSSSSPFGPTSTQSPFGPTSSSSPFGPTSSSSPFGPSSSSSPFGPSTSSSPFGPTSSSSLIQPSNFPASSVTSVSFPTPVIPFPFPSTTSLYTPTTVTVSAPSSFVSSPSFSPSISASQFSPGLSFTCNQPTSLLHSSAPLFHSSVRGVTVAEAGGQNNIAQEIGSQTKATGQQISGVNPFGSLPPITKMSIGGSGSSSTVRYGISSLPVQEKHAPVRISSLVAVRHISRRNRLPVQKYDPKINGPKVPFFIDDREIPVSQFVPRENPRALVIRSTEHWPMRTNSEKFFGIEDKLSSTHIYDNGEDCFGNVDTYSEKPKMEHADETPKERNSAVKVHDVEELLPKLQLSGYYTEPRIQELAAKERAEPGFCSHVKNFVVGRDGYGSIKFMGETDVRSIDLESILEFNNREVIVYKDESKKPAVGEGLNKPAEVTLLNIKCFDKKTGEQCMDGPRVEKYREMLKKKAEEQGADFVSYDPVGGEWKFRVQHF